MIGFAMVHPGWTFLIILVLAMAIHGVAEQVAIMFRGHPPDDGFWRRDEEDQ